MLFRTSSTDAWIAAIEDWTTWLQASGAPTSTLRLRRHQIRNLAERHLQTSPWKVTTDELTRYMSRPRWAAETRKSARAALRSFYGWAHSAGRTRHNPAAGLPPVKVPVAAPRPADHDTFVRALGVGDDRTRLMLLLGRRAGLRAAEIAGLRWDDVEPDQVRVLGKGRVTRIVPLHAALLVELDAWRDGGAHAYRYSAGADVWVFPGQTPGGLHPRHVSAALSAALGPGVTGHQLRHGFATRVLDATGDLAATQDLLGHASPATTRIYARTSARALRAAIDAL